MTTPAPRWISLWFRAAALYGVLALAPQYLLPQPSGAELVAYGFVGTALAFQIVFWVIGGDPVRYARLMPAAVAEKLAFGVPAIVLWAQETIPGIALVFGLIDLAIGAGFLIAWLRLRR